MAHTLMYVFYVHTYVPLVFYTPSLQPKWADCEYEDTQLSCRSNWTTIQTTRMGSAGALPKHCKTQSRQCTGHHTILLSLDNNRLIGIHSNSNGREGPSGREGPLPNQCLSANFLPSSVHVCVNNIMYAYTAHCTCPTFTPLVGSLTPPKHIHTRHGSGNGILFGFGTFILLLEEWHSVNSTL